MQRQQHKEIKPLINADERRFAASAPIKYKRASDHRALAIIGASTVENESINFYSLFHQLKTAQFGMFIPLAIFILSLKDMKKQPHGILI